MPLCNPQFAGTLSAFSSSPPPKVVRTLPQGTGQSTVSPADPNQEN
jgi:hypothetical protein